MADIVQRIITEVINLDQIEQNDALIKKLTDDMIALNAAMVQSGGGSAGQAAMMKRMAQAMADASDANKKLAASLDQTSGKMKGMLGGFQGLSRGAQDFAQGGLGGIINNLEQMGDGISKIIGRFTWLGSALTVAGTLAFVFKDKLSALWQELWPETAVTALQNLGKLQDRLKQLQDKPYKVSFDLMEIERLEEKIRKTQEALAAFERGRKTFMDEDLAARATKAVKTDIGGDNLAKAMADFEAGKATATGGNVYAGLEGYEEFRDARKKVADLRREADVIAKAMAVSPTDVYARDYRANILRGQAAELEREGIPKMEKQLQQKLAEVYKQRIGGFMSGDIGEIKRMRDMVKSRPDMFGKEFSQSVGTLPYTPEMAKQIWDSTQAAENDEVERTRRQADAKKAAHKKEEDDREVDRSVKDAESMAEDYRRDQIKAAQEQARSMQDAMILRMTGLQKAGSGFEGIMPEIRDTLSKRGIAGEALDRMVGDIFRELTKTYQRELQERIRPGVSPTAARNRLAEDSQDAIDKAAMGPVEKAAERAAKKAQTEANKQSREMDRFTSEQARGFRDAFARSDMGGVMYNDVLKGAQQGPFGDHYLPQVYQHLRMNQGNAGIPDGVLQEIAAKVVDDLYEQAARQMQAQFERKISAPGPAGGQQRGRGRQAPAGPAAGGFRSMGLGDMGMGGPVAPDDGAQIGATMQIARNQWMLAQAQAENDLQWRRVNALAHQVGQLIGNQNSRRIV